MMYEVEVRPGPGSEFFQYYTETVEAPTSQDAESRVKRANPGCIVRTTKSWSEYGDDDHSSSDDGGIGGGVLLFIASLVFVALAWKYLLLFGALALVILFILNTLKE